MSRAGIDVEWHAFFSRGGHVAIVRGNGWRRLEVQGPVGDAELSNLNGGECVTFHQLSYEDSKLFADAIERLMLGGDPA
jgi:hypothetical protein